MPFRLDRAFLRVSGPDAVGFLDNLLTQNVFRLREAGVLYSALLTPQGKVIADMFLWHDEHRDDPSVLMELDPTRAQDVNRRLTMYKLRANVAIEAVTDQVNAVYAREAFGSDAPDPRFPDYEFGWRDYAPFAVDFPGGLPAHEAHRLALGVPDLARDAGPDEVFALEALLEELNGVDFQKGCFVGQETVSRMKRRATTRKKFCAVTFEGEAPAPMTPVLAGEAQLGTVRSGMNGRAIALLRLDRAFEALEAGKTLTAGGKAIQLDPPQWLILPSRDAA